MRDMKLRTTDTITNYTKVLKTCPLTYIFFLSYWRFLVMMAHFFNRRICASRIAEVVFFQSRLNSC